MKRNTKKNSHETACFLLLLVVVVALLSVLVLHVSGLYDGLLPKKGVQINFMWNNFDMYGILAFVLAAFSLWYTFRSYKSQSETERNTSNVPVEDQRGKFRDLTRHEYRNLVCALATAVKYFDKGNFEGTQPLFYPSESHILKLQAAPEDFVLDINPQMVSAMSEMRLLMRNYNIEINVACNHLSRFAINQEAIGQDYDNLIYKPLYLVRKACEVEEKLDEKENGDEKILTGRIVGRLKAKWSRSVPSDAQRLHQLQERSIRIIVNEHLNKIYRSLSDFLGTDRKEDRNPYSKYFRFLSILDEEPDMTIRDVDRTGACARSFVVLFKERFNENKDKSNDESIEKEGIEKKEKSKELPWKWEYEDASERQRVNKRLDAIIQLLEGLKTKQPECYERILKYRDILESIRKEKEIDFTKFFALMLKLDVVVELRKIGMVNYE